MAFRSETVVLGMTGFQKIIFVVVILTGVTIVYKPRDVRPAKVVHFVMPGTGRKRDVLDDRCALIKFKPETQKKLHGIVSWYLSGPSKYQAIYSGTSETLLTVEYYDPSGNRIEQ